MTQLSEEESTRSEAALATVADQLGRAFIRPGEEGWDAARRPWNLAVDQRPAAVAYPRTIADVQLLLAVAAAEGFTVTVQPNGHGANGSMENCILVRTTAFDEVTIDAHSRTARIGAGVKWGSVAPLLDGTGLIALPGTNPDITVAGYLLSGGHSWFSRTYGVAAHSIVAVELVDATGTLQRITAESDPDLLWGLRGAGGLFGVVTALEITLFPAPTLFGGRLLFPGAVAEVVFDQAARLMDDAPNELNIILGMMNLPDIEMVPPPLRGQTVATVDVVFVGTATAGQTLLAPLLAAVTPLVDLTREFIPSQLGAVSDEPTAPSAAEDWSAVGATLDSESLHALIAAFRAATPAGLTLLQVRPLGGAQADAQAASGGVAGHLDGGFVTFAAAIIMDPTRVIDRQAVFAPFDQAMRGRAGSGNLPSMLGNGAQLADAYSPAALARLAEIKRRVDPNNLFRSNRALP
ncbi:FAD-binding protein [Glaciibacter psychrotolerans]|uniref:FAD/FMN-containing dehydrogenase n=1 Tax=Glaciibacter psychrotolerans TaxID=670054 RepID=A0A7Z0ED47_9MICO|nr:FAD/FMN-containing dehydrogenase [Leifsonia psychrotolerans]